MKTIEEIFNYIIYYRDISLNYFKGNILPNIEQYYINIYNLILNYKIETILVLLVFWYFYRKYTNRRRILKQKKYKKVKLTKNKKYYNTGYRFEVCLKDIIKFKIRLADYCDKKGCRFNYFFNIKLFNLEFLRTKITDQDGYMYKRKITFRS